MRLPFVNQATRKSVQFTQTFTGYDHNLKKIASSYGNTYEDESSFWDMTNMCMDDYPIIETRKGRTKYELEPTVQTGTNYVSVFATGDKLLIANGTSLIFGSFEEGFTTIASNIENSRKRFSAIGAKVLMLPDGLVFNTHDSTLVPVVKRFESTTYPLTITPCVLGDDGNYSTIQYVSQDTEPTDKTIYWYDTKNKTLKKYSPVSYTWVAVGTAYLMVKANENDTALKTFFDQDIDSWDTISFTSLACSSASQQEELDKIAKNNGDKGKGDNVIFEHGTDYVVIAGFVKSPITVTAYIIERRMPNLDYITSLNNRIWGCSSEDHEIYACKLGDPTQWYNYPGIASDSYAATIGSAGDFTGATSLNSYALFFKENSLFKVYGDYPSNFQVVEIICDGVEKGSEHSIQEIGGVLYYKGINGMMMYDGSIPSGFTAVFGGVRYTDAVAGAVQNKYYISMKNGSKQAMFVYDTITGCWVKEDDFKAIQFTKYDNKLIAVDDNNIIWSFPEDRITDLATGTTEADIPWMLDTGNRGLALPGQKYISRLTFRVDLIGSLNVYVSYNNVDFLHVFTTSTTELRSFNIPIKVKRCDHFKLKLEGEGHIKVYSYSYYLEAGSDRQKC